VGAILRAPGRNFSLRRYTRNPKHSHPKEDRDSSVSSDSSSNTGSSVAYSNNLSIDSNVFMCPFIGGDWMGDVEEPGEGLSVCEKVTYIIGLGVMLFTIAFFTDKHNIHKVDSDEDEA